MDYYIGLDIGTTAVKGLISTPEGHILGEARRTTEFIYPKSGFIEFDPAKHYQSVCEVISELVSLVTNVSNIKALSVAAASGNTILLNDKHQPITNIVSWMDERAIGLQPKGIDTKEVHRIVGWPWVNGLFPFGHLSWYKDNEPHIYNIKRRVCMNNDWLYFMLTGNWALDTSTATTFYLQNQIEMKWHKPYLEVLNIDVESLSEIGNSATPMGKINEKAAYDTGLSKGTTVVLGSFDHPAAARGTGFTEEGDLLLSCGTSWVGFYPVKDRDIALSQGLLVDPFITHKSLWGTMFSLPHIDVLINWYIDAFVVNSKKGLDSNKYKLFDKYAIKAKPGAGGCFVNLFLNSKDVLTSLELQNTLLKEYSSYSKENIARSLMEATAFRMKSNIERLEKAGISAKRIAMVGGAAESPIWPQIVSDVTGVPIKLANGQHAGALGAAMLASIGAGEYSDESEAFLGFQKTSAKARTIYPDKIRKNIYDEVYFDFLSHFEKKDL